MKTIGRGICLFVLLTLCMTGVVFGQAIAPAGTAPAGAPPSVAATPATGPALLTPGTGGLPGTAPAAPVKPLSLDDVMVAVVVGDVPGFIAQYEALDKLLRPAAAAEARPRAALAKMLNDPTLSGLPPQSGAVALFFPGGVRVICAEVAPAMMTSYKDTITSTVSTKTDVAGGMLVTSRSDEGLAVGRALASQIKGKYLSGPRKPEINVTVPLQGIVARYQNEIQSVIQAIPMGMTMQMQMQMQQTQGQTGAAQPDLAAVQKAARIIEGELRGFYAVGKQVNSVELAIKLPATGPSLDLTLVPKPGSDLATLAAAPVPKGQDLLKLLPGQGAIRGTGSYNVGAVSDFAVKLATTVMQEMSLPPADQQAVMDYIKRMSDADTGVSAASICIPGQSFMSGSAAIGIKDANAALAMLEKMNEMFTSSGLAQSGMSASAKFTKNVRQYKNIQIHQMVMDQKFPTMPGSPAVGGAGGITTKIDIAIVGDVLLYAMAPDSIEQLIDAAQTKSNPGAKPLTATAKLPAGGCIYADVDLGGLAAGFGSMVSAAVPMGDMTPIADFSRALAGAPPLTLAAYSDKEGLRLTIVLPQDTAVRIGQMKRSAPAPQPGMAPGQYRPAPAGAGGAVPGMPPGMARPLPRRPSTAATPAVRVAPGAPIGAK